jgi:hypothetical protein
MACFLGAGLIIDPVNQAILPTKVGEAQNVEALLKLNSSTSRSRILLVLFADVSLLQLRRRHPGVHQPKSRVEDC